MQAAELEFVRDGAGIISGAVSSSVLDRILPAFDLGQRNRPGARSLDVPEGIAAVVAPDGALGGLAQAYRPPNGRPMRPVRVLLFDKTPETNWAVPWHQDRTIAVRVRHDVPGFESWNVKDGVTHVEPPVKLLAGMVTLRLHLDDTGRDNGPLDIVPGSHLLGRLPAAEVVRVGHAGPVARCVARKGDVLAMRLLTVHKSERAAKASRRRVLHVDYSSDDLPPPLVWQAGEG